VDHGNPEDMRKCRRNERNADEGEPGEEENASLAAIESGRGSTTCLLTYTENKLKRTRTRAGNEGKRGKSGEEGGREKARERVVCVFSLARRRWRRLHQAVQTERAFLRFPRHVCRSRRTRGKTRREKGQRSSTFPTGAMSSGLLTPVAVFPKALGNETSGRKCAREGEMELQSRPARKGRFEQVAILSLYC
jgi:hypothetical protein